MTRSVYGIAVGNNTLAEVFFFYYFIFDFHSFVSNINCCYMEIEIFSSSQAHGNMCTAKKVSNGAATCEYQRI